MNEIVLRRYLHIGITVAGTAVCALFSIKCAIILFITSALIFAVHEFTENIRKKRILSLCDDIDRILRGNNTVSFDDYRENELSILTAEIHKMTIRLREQNSALFSEKNTLKESLEDIAHQLRTPLTSMVLLLEMLRSPELPRSRYIEYVTELGSLLSRMNWLIETLLGLSRIDAGAVKFRQDNISCRELIENALEPISFPLEVKNIDIKVDIQENASFCGDIQYFTEALLNILKNCMEHTPENGCITISAASNPIYANIIVTDSGKGFQNEEIPHIFERFYRSCEDSSSGYGIGLAFAKRIVTAQNGVLEAKNAPTGGACFDMRIYSTAV